MALFELHSKQCVLVLSFDVVYWACLERPPWCTLVWPNRAYVAHTRLVAIIRTETRDCPEGRDCPGLVRQAYKSAGSLGLVWHKTFRPGHIQNLASKY